MGRDWEGYVPYYLHWDTDIGAPVSKIMNKAEVDIYLIENEFSPNAKGITFLEVHSAQALLSFNTAGPGGMYITWEQILDYYKHD